MSRYTPDHPRYCSPARWAEIKAIRPASSSASPQSGKNRAQRQRIQYGFHCLTARGRHQTFVPPSKNKAVLRFKAMIRAARKREFLTETSRAAALLRFNRRREALGAPPMDHIPAGCPGSFTERRAA